MAVIEAKAERIACPASLASGGKRNRTVRPANRGPREGGSHLNHDDHSKAIERFCFYLYADYQSGH